MSVTPPEGGWKHQAAVISPDGAEHLITGELAVMFDLMICSMDWGSGMLADEDAQVIVKIGLLCGFEIPTCDRVYTENWGKYTAEQVHAKCTRHAQHGGFHQGPATARGRRIYQAGIYIDDEQPESLGIYMWNDKSERVMDAQIVKTLPLEA